MEVDRRDDAQQLKLVDGGFYWCTTEPWNEVLRTCAIVHNTLGQTKQIGSKSINNLDAPNHRV